MSNSDHNNIDNDNSNRNNNYYWTRSHVVNRDLDVTQRFCTRHCVIQITSAEETAGHVAFY